jgi:hypothetical protein
MPPRLRNQRAEPEEKAKRTPVTPTLLHAEMPLYAGTAEGAGHLLIARAGVVSEMCVQLPVPCAVTVGVSGSGTSTSTELGVLEAGYHESKLQFSVKRGDVLALTVVPHVDGDPQGPLRALFSATFKPANKG